MTLSKTIIDPASGLTLLEVLITLTLLSLLTIALFGTLRFGTRIWEAAATTTAGLDDVRAAEQQITALISEAYPQVEFHDATHSTIAFDGEPARLRVLVPDSEITGAMAYTTLRIASSDGGNALILERQLELSPTAGEQTTQVLLRGVQALQISYFGADARGDKPYWHRQWQGRTRPPLFVRVRAALVYARAAWPDLVVAPEIAGDIDCTADSLTGFCQGH